MYQRHIDYIIEQKDAIGRPHQVLMSPLGKNWLNEKYQHQLLENIWEVSFIQMYPNIMLKMAEHNLIQLDNQDKIREILSSDDKKSKLNVLYGLLHSQGQMNFYLTKVYTEVIYKEILEDHSDKIIHIETDTFQTKELFDISKYCSLEYEVEKLDIAYFYKRKQYCKQIGTHLKFSGFTKSAKESVASDFKSKLREYNLSKLI